MPPGTRFHEADLSGSTSLADYVIQHYGRLMTKHEYAVYRHLTALYKGREEAPGPGTAAETEGLGSLRFGLSDDPRVIADAQAGWEGARERIAQRIVRDHPDEVYLNHCPACGALTRTPTARLCLACGHTWHHVPRDVRL